LNQADGLTPNQTGKPIVTISKVVPVVVVLTQLLPIETVTSLVVTSSDPRKFAA
jgi:hypothetical protein